MNMPIDSQAHILALRPLARLKKAIAGFTLIETLLAITIMGIVAGISIPIFYGTYQHQQMLNTANEMISAIKMARSKALANDQGAYKLDPPIHTCDATHPYVEKYLFSIDADKKGYAVKPGLLSNGGACKTSPAPDSILEVRLPDSIKVNATGGSSSFPISYTTVSGSFSVEPGQIAWIDLVSDGALNNSTHYYICITPSDLYAQTTACS